METTETGVFRVVFGAREFLLRRRLTDDLPEALLVKPRAAYLWADSRGAS